MPASLRRDRRMAPGRLVVFPVVAGRARLLPLAAVHGGSPRCRSFRRASGIPAGAGRRRHRGNDAAPCRRRRCTARDGASMTPPRRRWRALRRGLALALGLAPRVRCRARVASVVAGAFARLVPQQDLGTRGPLRQGAPRPQRRAHARGDVRRRAHRQRAVGRCEPAVRGARPGRVPARLAPPRRSLARDEDDPARRRGPSPAPGRRPAQLAPARSRGPRPGPLLVPGARAAPDRAELRPRRRRARAEQPRQRPRCGGRRDRGRQGARQPRRLRRPLARRRLQGQRRHRTRDHLLRERPLVPAARPCRRARRAPRSRRPGRRPVPRPADRRRDDRQRQLARRPSPGDRRRARPSRAPFASKGGWSPTTPSTPSSPRARRSAPPTWPATLAWSRRGERRSFSATLASDATDLADLLWLAGKGASTAAAGVQGGEARRRRGLAGGSARPVRRRARARCHRRLPGEALSRRRGAAAAEPEAQRPGSTPACWRSRISTSAGAAATRPARLGLDLRQHPPRSQAQLETRGVRIEALFPASDEKQRITGVLRGRSALKATGDDVEALARQPLGNGFRHALGRNDPEPARCADGPAGRQDGAQLHQRQPSRCPCLARRSMPSWAAARRASAASSSTAPTPAPPAAASSTCATARST